MTDRAVPNLPSRDLDSTIAFYGGFGLSPTYRGDSWLILRSGGLELEFFLFADLVPAESNAMCSIRVDDVDALYARIRDSGVPERSSGHPRLVPVRRQPWGLRAGFLVDIDGSQLQLIGNGS
ncbi:bleomycin resistance protein [Rathayibacter tanaceti]|uniref:Bleomycin resistance protein n=2 Tax=Rathayibacter tanaceti TaxID=1671680 RepID=A0A166HHK8_9MICO|nr:bleomycin resistance protein [Rathayibacter tanaceti]KZX20606.1 Bleomycin resistance protein [Rathayibacter tanaceti]QHC55316.1 bleomycin resistance protein [Rathayibacter tanaceti]TCO36384.1 hypothetical protein EV639_10763 [Rathayibacter tanaceti]